MSLDFSSGSTQGQHSIYTQPDLETSFNIHGPDNTNSPSHPQLSSTMPSHSFDHPESLDTAEHNNYDIFPPSNTNGTFTSSRYRTNASSSSSLGPSYSLNHDVYTHPPFGDSVPSFNGPNGHYDMMGGLSSSYSSGKVSPLTPNDPVSNLHHSNGFSSVAPGKDFSQNYTEMQDRRLSSVNPSGYQNDFAEDYTMGSLNNGLNFPQSSLQHFPNRFPDTRFNHGGTAMPAHISGSHGPDIMRGVAPHVTHSYGEVPHYISPSPHTDMSLRVPTVDETLARMKLQGHSLMGQPNDLQSFIR